MSGAECILCSGMKLQISYKKLKFSEKDMLEITKTIGKQSVFGKEMDCFECLNLNNKQHHKLYKYSGYLSEPINGLVGEGVVGILECDNFELIFDWNKVHISNNMIDLSKLKGLSEFAHGTHRPVGAFSSADTYYPFTPPGNNWEIFFLNPYGSILKLNVTPMSLRERIFGKWELKNGKGESTIYVAKGTSFDPQSSDYAEIMQQGKKYNDNLQKYVSGTNSYSKKIKDLSLSEFTDDDYCKGSKHSALYGAIVSVMSCEGLGSIRITGGQLGQLGECRLSELMSYIIQLGLPQRILIRSCRGFNPYSKKLWQAAFNIGPTVMESLGVLSSDQWKMPDRFSANNATYDTVTMQKGQMLRTNKGITSNKDNINITSNTQKSFRIDKNINEKIKVEEYIRVKNFNDQLKNKITLNDSQDLLSGKAQNKFIDNTSKPSTAQIPNNGGIELEPLFPSNQFKQRDLSYKSISGVQASDFGPNSGGNHIDKFGKQIQPYYNNLCIRLEEMSKKENFNEAHQEFIAYIMEFLHPNYVNTPYKRILKLRANFTAISNKCDRFFKNRVSNAIKECSGDQISLDSLMDRLNCPQFKSHN